MCYEKNKNKKFFIIKFIKSYIYYNVNILYLYSFTIKHLKKLKNTEIHDK